MNNGIDSAIDLVQAGYIHLLKLKVGVATQVNYVFIGTGYKVIQRQHAVAPFEQVFTHMRADKTGAARDYISQMDPPYSMVHSVQNSCSFRRGRKSRFY